MGMTTSSTGDAKPLPTSSSIREANATDAMKSTVRSQGRWLDGTSCAARLAAAITNKTAVVPCVSRSRRDSLVRTRSREAATSSVWRSTAAEEVLTMDGLGSSRLAS
jgi:hypothetical protein